MLVRTLLMDWSICPTDDAVSSVDGAVRTRSRASTRERSAICSLTVRYVGAQLAKSGAWSAPVSSTSARTAAAVAAECKRPSDLLVAEGEVAGGDPLNERRRSILRWSLTVRNEWKE